MEKIDENKFPSTFINEYMNIPKLPLGLYGRITRKIDNKIWRNRMILATAASLLIAISVFQVYKSQEKQVASFAPDVAEALGEVSGYFNDDIYQKNENSYAYYEDIPFSQQQ